MNRREFLNCTFSLAMVGGGPRAPRCAPDLRLGLLSDLHINLKPGARTSPAAERFRSALEYFREREVDGVLVSGDLTDTGLKDEFELMARVWNEVFPRGRGKFGRKVANLMHYGDHDSEARFYRLDRLTPIYAAAGLKVPPSLSEGDLCKTIWEECFGEEWSPIRLAKVKDYDFVLASHTRKNVARAVGLDTVLAKLAPDPSRPFFYSQHRWIHGTYLAEEGMDCLADGGHNGPVLAKYPNVVAFSGHTHYMLTDDRNVWQDGSYTVINTSSLAYASCFRQHENGVDISWLKDDPARNSQMKRIDNKQGHHGMVMSLSGDRIVLERRDFGLNRSLGPDLVLSVQPRDRVKIGTSARRLAESVAPEFPSGAAISIAKGPGVNRRGEKVDQIELTFPVANPTSTTPRAHDYVVRAFDEKGAVVSEKRVYSPSIMLPPECDCGPVHCVFSRAEIAKATRFTISPANCWRKEGAAVSRLP